MLRGYLPLILALFAASRLIAADPGESLETTPGGSYARVRVAVTYPGGENGRNGAGEPAADTGGVTLAPVVTIDEFPGEGIVSESIPFGDGGRVLATLYGTPITEEDVLRELWDRRGKETFEWLVGRDILQRELRRLRLDVTEREVEAGMQKHLAVLRMVYPHLSRPDALTRAASGMAAGEYRERTVWVELALREVMKATLEVREDDLRSFYASMQADFIRPERVRISQVFIPPRAAGGDDGIPSPEDWSRAETQILEAHNRLRLGEDFADVARAYGTGGQLSRWVRRGELLRELEDAAFSIRPGSMTTPIRTSMGFHVVTVEEKEERNVPKFEEVRDEVRGRFEEERFVRLAGEFMARLKEKALENGGLIMAEAEPFSEGGR